MALDIGWRPGEVRESIWIDDPSLRNVSSAAREAWKEDGDASHLTPFIVDGDPTKIVFRTLSSSEAAYVRSLYFEDGWELACIAAFRIGADFPDMPDNHVHASGKMLKKTVKVGSLRMLSDDVVRGVNVAAPPKGDQSGSALGMVLFYGNLIFNAALLTKSEKKASSQPSTPTPSGAAG